MIINRTYKERKRNRLQGFDYSKDNAYYITICVHDHNKCFGIIADGKMQINEYGKIANQQFEWLANNYPYVKIPVWIIMPDHVHAIIEIDRDRGRSRVTGRSRPSPTTMPKIKPLPELIGAYKTTTSKKLHQSGYIDFRWQRSYHDHIIRNSTEYDRIFHYIENNPVNNISDKPELVN